MLNTTTNNKLNRFFKNKNILTFKNNYFNYSWVYQSLCNNNPPKQLEFFRISQKNLKFTYNSTFNKTQKRFFFKKTLILHSNGKTQNFYDVLGVDRKSSSDQIKQAYLKLAKIYHPDVNREKDADEKFKSITLAYEALSNQKNRELYDASTGNDRMDKWNNWKDEEEFSKQNKARAQQDKYAGGFYKNSHESNFWKGEREDFEEKFYKDYENIFGAGWKESKPQKGEDILLEISISIFDSYNGATKGIKFTRKEKCHSCNGMRAAKGSRPSKCFACNASGEVKTSSFSSKKCGHCRGLGYIIKNPCGECQAEGVKTYEVQEAIQLPKGIKNETKLKFEKKGHCSENHDTISGDLLVNVTVEEDEEYKRENDDLVSDLEISLADAIVGKTIQYTNFDGSLKTIEIKPGTQANEKIIFKNLGFVNPEDNKIRGDQILVVKIKIPSISSFTVEDQIKMRNIFEKKK